MQQVVCVSRHVFEHTLFPVVCVYKCSKLEYLLQLYSYICCTGPTPPRKVQLDSLTATTVRVMWNVPAYVNGTIDKYRVDFRNSTNKISTTAGPNSASVTLSHLRPYTNYNVTVRAYATLPGAKKLLGEKSEVVPFRTRQGSKLCHHEKPYTPFEAV